MRKPGRARGGVPLGPGLCQSESGPKPPSGTPQLTQTDKPKQLSQFARPLINLANQAKNRHWECRGPLIDLTNQSEQVWPFVYLVDLAAKSKLTRKSHGCACAGPRPSDRTSLSWPLRKKCFTMRRLPAELPTQTGFAPCDAVPDFLGHNGPRESSSARALWTTG